MKTTSLDGCGSGQQSNQATTTETKKQNINLNINPGGFICCTASRADC